MAFDAAGAFLARLLDFPFAYLSPIPLLIYALTGFLVAPGRSIRTGLWAGAIVGFVDTTLGWAILWIIGPGDVSSLQPTLDMFVGAAVIAVLLGAICGLVGGAIGLKLRERNGVTSGPGK
ncbi:MAG: hypothetical protein WA821_08060 [Anaerolineales bacterium]